MILKQLIYILSLLFTFNSFCLSQEPSSTKKTPSHERLEQLQQDDDFLKLMDKMKVVEERMSQNKRYNCIKAFGHAGFCNCLIDELPVGLSFKDYIIIVTSTKEELGYDKLSKDDKKMVDKVITARDLCVHKFNREGKPE